MIVNIIIGDLALAQMHEIATISSLNTIHLALNVCG